ncbi:MAG: MFS transporter [Rhodocyclales bacterium]|nr:MFS transporter [Rhodocyclales bacterium]
MTAEIVESPALGREVFLLSCAAFASAVALRLCDPLLPVLARDFGTTVGRAALVVTATSVAYGIFQLLFGPLGDHYGKFRVIAAACLASTVGAFACAASPSLEVLALARALNGATTAALIPLAMAWIGDVVAFEQRQATLAKFMSGQIVGLVCGQAIAGFFADHFGWRWAFALLGAIYFWVGLLLLGSLRRHRHAAAGTEAAASSVGRFRLVLGNRHARFILAVVFIEAMATFGTIAFIPAFLHERFRISLFHAGVVVAAIGLGGLGYTLFARRWVRALGQVRLARTGGLLMGGAFALLAMAPAWGWGVVACTVAGLGFYQMHNTLQTMATQMTPAARGTAVSLFAFCFFLGQAAGVAIGAIGVDHVGAHWLFAVSALTLPLTGALLARYLKAGTQSESGVVRSGR